MRARAIVEGTIREERIRGEYWIFPDGNVHFCDGDVGDVNHEGYAMMHAMGLVRNAMGLRDADEDHVDQLLTDIRDAWSENANETRDTEDDVWRQYDDYDIADLMAKKHGVDPKLLAIALDRQGGDARLYAAQHWGWHALRGDHVETWDITEGSLGAIADGIMAALDDSGVEHVDPEHEFNIFAYRGRRSLSLTYRQLEAGDFGGQAQPPGQGSDQVRKMDQDASPDFYKGNLGDSLGRCRHRLGRSMHTCSRSAVVWRNGKGYCTRHDPEKQHSTTPLDGRHRFDWVAEVLEAESGLKVLLKAAKWLRKDDVDFFDDGCADVCETLAEFGHQRGIQCQVIYGYVTAGGERIAHAWMNVGGEFFDPLAAVIRWRGRDYEPASEVGQCLQGEAQTWRFNARDER